MDLEKWNSLRLPAKVSAIGKEHLLVAEGPDLSGLGSKMYLQPGETFPSCWSYYNYELVEEAVVPEPEKPKTFYILWCPTSEKPPTAQFTSEKAARKVAEKMAKQSPGETFYVMKVVAGVKVAVVTVEEFA